MSSIHSGNGCLYVSGMNEAVTAPMMPAIRNTAYINGGLVSPLIKQNVINFFTIQAEYFKQNLKYFQQGLHRVKEPTKGVENLFSNPRL